MNKLTPKQRDYLCSKVRAAFGNTCADLYGISAERVRELTIQLINQCTEQEFPVLKMEWYYGAENQDDINHYFYIELSEKKDIRIHVADCVADSFAINMNTEQFKQFTAGCQKIVEWLEKQST